MIPRTSMPTHVYAHTHNQANFVFQKGEEHKRICPPKVHRSEEKKQTGEQTKPSQKFTKLKVDITYPT